MSSKRFILGATCAALVSILALLLLTLLMMSRREIKQAPVAHNGSPKGEEDSRKPLVSSASTAGQPAGMPHFQGRPGGNSSDGSPPLPSATAASSVSRDGGPAPLFVRQAAPPAIPNEIQNETDPIRKGELMKMHRLATARVQVSMLKHREFLLRNSMAEGKNRGSWSAEKIRTAEEDLRDLRVGIKKAEQDLDKVRTEVGGDIDKDSP